ncbi:unnamed protein product, partial [Adineta steineri]
YHKQILTFEIVKIATKFMIDSIYISVKHDDLTLEGIK